MWTVTVLTPNGRRHTATYSPNTTLLQVLEQTCKKYKFNAEEYDLTHHNRIIDITLTLRFSGLPNNTLLEMATTKKIRVESDVTICLQLEDGNRLMGTFKPSQTLYEIILSLAEDICKEMSNPVIIYMRKEVNGTELLKETTLKSLGLMSGRSIMRLIDRSTEQLKIQANVSTLLPQKIKESEESVEFITQEPVEIESNPTNTTLLENEESNKNICSDIVQDEIVQKSIYVDDNICSKVEPEPIAEEFIENKLLDDIVILGERNALVFSQEMSNGISFDELPDDFFDLSVHEVKKLYLELGMKRKKIEDKILKTVVSRNSEKNEKISKKLKKHEKVILRIVFPDRTVLQGIFAPLEKIEVVKEFVKPYLQNCDETFDLYVTPPKQILPFDATLLDVECVPSAILHFGPHDRNSSDRFNVQYLKEDILSKLTTPKAALLSASLSRENK